MNLPKKSLATLMGALSLGTAQDVHAQQKPDSTSQTDTTITRTADTTRTDSTATDSLTQQPDSLKNVQPDSTLGDTLSMEECKQYCTRIDTSQEKQEEIKRKIRAGKLGSREVLTFLEQPGNVNSAAYRDEALPEVGNADTLWINDENLNIEGNFQVTGDLPDGYSFIKKGEHLGIVKEPNAEYERLNFTIANDQEAVRMLVGLPQDEINDIISDYEQEIGDLETKVDQAQNRRQAIQRKKNVLERNYQDLRDDLKETKESLQNTENELEGYQIDRSMWDVSLGPTVSSSPDGNYELGGEISASLPVGIVERTEDGGFNGNGIEIAMEYTQGATQLPTETSTERTQVPNNRPIDVERVLEVEKQPRQESSTIAGSVELPVSTTFSVGPKVGVRSIDRETETINESYTVKGGEKIDRETETNTTTNDINNIRVGANLSAKLTDRIEASLSGTLNKEREPRGSVSITYDLVGDSYE